VKRYKYFHPSITACLVSRWSSVEFQELSWNILHDSPVLYSSVKSPDYVYKFSLFSHKKDNQYRCYRRRELGKQCVHSLLFLMIWSLGEKAHDHEIRRCNRRDGGQVTPHDRVTPTPLLRASDVCRQYRIWHDRVDVTQSTLKEVIAFTSWRRLHWTQLTDSWSRRRFKCVCIQKVRKLFGLVCLLKDC